MSIISGRAEEAQLRALVEKFTRLLPRRDGAFFMLECLRELLPIYESSCTPGTPQHSQVRRALELIETAVRMPTELSDDQIFAAMQLALQAQNANRRGLVAQRTPAVWLAESVQRFASSLRWEQTPATMHGLRAEALELTQYCISGANRSVEALLKKQWKRLLPYIQYRAGDLLTSGFPSSQPRLEGEPQTVAMAALIQEALHEEILFLETGAKTELDRDILNRVSDGYQEISAAKTWVDAFIAPPGANPNVWRAAVFGCWGTLRNPSALNTAWSNLHNFSREEIGRKKKTKLVVGARLERSLRVPGGISAQGVSTFLRSLRNMPLTQQRHQLDQLRANPELSAVLEGRSDLANELTNAELATNRTPQEVADDIAAEIARIYWYEAANQADEIKRYNRGDRIYLELMDGDYDFIGSEWKKAYGVQERSVRQEGSRRIGINLDRKYDIGRTSADYYRGYVQDAAEAADEAADEESVEEATPRVVSEGDRERSRQSAQRLGIPATIQRSGLPSGVDPDAVERALQRGRGDDDDDVMGVHPRKKALDLPSLLRTKEALKILNELPGGDARGWDLGGCWVLAEALRLQFGGELVIVRETRGPIEHIALKLGKCYVDGSGVYENRDKFVRHLEKRIPIRVRIVPFTAEEQSYQREKKTISFRVKSVQALKALMVKHDLRLSACNSVTIRSGADQVGADPSGNLQQLKLLAEKLSAMYRHMKRTRGDPYVWACKEIYEKADAANLWRQFFIVAGCLFDDLSTGVNKLDTLARKYSKGLKHQATLGLFNSIVPYRVRANYSPWAFDTFIDVLDNVTWGCDALLRRELPDIELLMYFSPWETYMSISLGSMLTELITQIKANMGSMGRKSFIDYEAMKPLRDYVASQPEGIRGVYYHQKSKGKKQ